MAEYFGKLPDGGQAMLYTVGSSQLKIRVSDLGAALVSVEAKDRTGAFVDVCLGFRQAEKYLTEDGCIGASVGRNANRIGGSQFLLNGQPVKLAANEGKNSLHSGPDVWYHRLWKVLSSSENAITFGLDTPHMDQGFPGGGKVEVTYEVSGTALRITYRGTFDRDTVFNMTNHSYFNLAGQDKPELAMEQLLYVRASRYTQVDSTSIPTGEILPVDGTALDFRSPRALGRNREQDPLLAPQRGIDHNLVLDTAGFDVSAAKLYSPHSGISMTVFTDCPGIQVYCANFLDTVGKDGVHYGPNSAVCLETQFAPDSMNHPQWPQPVAKAGQCAQSVTEFRFGVE